MKETERKREIRERERGREGEGGRERSGENYRITHVMEQDSHRAVTYAYNSWPKAVRG